MNKTYKHNFHKEYETRERSYYQIFFKTNTKIPLSMYESGGAVKNVYLPNCSDRPQNHIIVETETKNSSKDIHTFMEKTKGCDIFMIYPIEKTVVTQINKKNEKVYQTIHHVYAKQKKYNLTIEASDGKNTQENEERDTYLYTEMAKQIENFLVDSLHKNETIKNIIDEVHKENKDKKSPLMMCLALEKFMSELNPNLQPCLKRNMSMVKQKIDEGTWQQMTFDETTDVLQKKKKGNENNNKTKNIQTQNKIPERRKSI